MSWVLYILSNLLIFISAKWYVLPHDNLKPWVGLAGMVLGIIVTFYIGCFMGKRGD